MIDDLERLQRERAAIAERLGVDPSRPLAVIGALDVLRGDRDAALVRAQHAEAVLQRVYLALNKVGAPKTGPCDPILNEDGVRNLRPEERILAIMGVL
jgi:hypothetical protein